MQAAPKANYDVCVIGGGPAGLATALQLRAANSHISIVVMEASNYLQPRVGESIAPGLESVLQAIGAEHLLSEHKHLPSAGVSSCWGSSEVHTNDFLLFPRGRGWHLNRSVFDKDLATLASERGIHVCAGYRFKQSKYVQSNWQLSFICEQANAKNTTNSEVFLSCAFVVDASGRTAKFAKQQGSKPIQLDSLICIYSYINRNHLDKPFAEIKPFADGWSYSAPLPNNKKIVALMTDSDIASAKHYKQITVWQNTLCNVANISQHALLPNQPLNVWPAYSVVNPQITGSHWLAVGDAAMCYDPLSSQGITKSLVQGIYAGHALSDWFASSTNESKQQALRTYANSCSSGFQNYYAKWCEYYKLENRWQSATFWRRRIFNLADLNPNHYLSVNTHLKNKYWPHLTSWQQTAVCETVDAEPDKPLWHIVNRLKEQWQKPGALKLPDEYIINVLLALTREGFLEVSVEKKVQQDVLQKAGQRYAHN
ncbi:tryptophan 7-halogenase [Saccharophagus degradans]|uniref:NAD(P)/FAD-dependent oxidoreductase n=1 Tax=Saccharophagus degradans TaxID=86304 RepID=UPI0024782219|nr:tryptophan 7-halogenase [Saccharophagus degradans]WGO98273.1 tryptophan 7-halogenase [Saccharophagus degradans]